MALVAKDIKGMLSIKLKSRHDSYTDQYNRIFMVKMFLVASLIMGISWYNDKINCIVPGSHGVSGGFVSAACWIQGVYVYKELQGMVDQVAYFGIPKNMDHDGMIKGTKDLCITKPKLGEPKSALCEPMTKTFFLQYQWMPFLVAAIGIAYYAPYLLFRAANSDLISLKDAVKADNKDAEKIAKYYFNTRSNPPKSLVLRVICNILIKVLYICSNLIAFMGFNNLLNNEFVRYGSTWIQWSQLDNSMAYDYMGMRDFPKPGNLLLPPFGYCEMFESARDVKHTLANKHKFVCELSQNILYQYCFIVMWFAIVFGIFISFVGLVLLIVHYLIGILGVRTRIHTLLDKNKYYIDSGSRARGKSGGRIYKALTFREVEYLEFIRKRDIALFGEVVEKLQKKLFGEDSPLPPPPHAQDVPLYPSLPHKQMDDEV